MAIPLPTPVSSYQPTPINIKKSTSAITRLRRTRREAFLRMAPVLLIKLLSCLLIESALNESASTTSLLCLDLIPLVGLVFSFF